MAFKGKEIGKQDLIDSIFEKLFILFFPLRLSILVNKFIELLMSGKEELILWIKFPVDILEHFAALILFSLNIFFQPFNNIFNSVIGQKLVNNVIVNDIIPIVNKWFDNLCFVVLLAGRINIVMIQLPQTVDSGDVIVEVFWA